MKYNFKEWNKINFEEWKADYPLHSPSERAEIYDFEHSTTNNTFFHNKEIYNFISNVMFKEEDPLRIVEFGGGKGELACYIFNNLPKKALRRILYWDNYEISKVAVNKSVCNHSKYKAIYLEDFAWNLDIYVNYNVCIMSHFMEHIKSSELKKLFGKLKYINHFYIDAPIFDTTEEVNWSEKDETHVLDAGWNDIKKLLPNFEIKNQTSIKYFHKK